MLAEKFSSHTNPVGMWMSEKLDGVRALFVKGKFYSRNGNVYQAPAWFVKEMPPNAVLDGELYTSRGEFQRIMSIVTKHVPIDSEWRTIRYMVFDIPVPDMPFEDRYAALQSLVSDYNSPYLTLVENQRVRSTAELEAFHRRVRAQGGEGLILRKPQSLYENKRSASLLKMKKDDDDEAVVVGHEFGSGKNATVLGKLVVKWKHTTSTFHVGTGFTDAQRRNYKKLFPVGIIIKIRYNGMTGSRKPRFPVFLGIRDSRDV